MVFLTNRAGKRFVGCHFSTVVLQLRQERGVWYMDAEVFGSFVQTRRKALGMTQLELAEKLNVTAKAVSRWERGVGFPDIKLLEPLAQALEITIVELMQSKLIEEDISKETAAVLVSDTVTTMRQQEKLSRRKLVKLILGSAGILLAQIFLLYVYYAILRAQYRWIGAGVYFLAFGGGNWCHQVWRCYVTGEKDLEFRSIKYTWQVVVSMITFFAGVFLLVWAACVGGIGPVSRDNLFAIGMVVMITSGISYMTHAEEKEEQEFED